MMRNSLVLTALLTWTLACSSVVNNPGSNGDAGAPHTGGRSGIGSATSLGGASTSSKNSTKTAAGGNSNAGTDTSSGAHTSVGTGGSGAAPSSGGTAAVGGRLVTDGSGGDAPLSGGSASTDPVTIGGATAVGGAVGVGSAPANGGTAAKGGSEAGGAKPTGGAATGCTGQTKDCNGTCIPVTSCCGACAGDTPICDKGTCVGRSNGDRCDSSSECTSKVCADGVCCNVACDGQCEACNLSTSKGTCSPSTTSRATNPCAGEGTTCGGTCDGTVAHRKACVYPTSSTSCGPGASCNTATSQATAAQSCNGAGVCAVPTVKNCAPYGCNANATACATGCSSSSQGVCGGSCVDITSDPSHCGGSCQVCPSTTPRCSGAVCVQCTEAVDCRNLGYGSGSVCGSNHTCQCHPQVASNVLKNPGFNGSLNSWTYAPCTSCTTMPVTYDGAADVEGCPASGSVRLSYYGFAFGRVSQCVSVKASQGYRFGFLYKQTSPNAGDVTCDLNQYSGSNCSGDILPDVHGVSSGAVPPQGTWGSSSDMFVTSSSAASLEVSCGHTYTYDIWLDQIYLNESGQYF